MAANTRKRLDHKGKPLSWFNDIQTEHWGRNPTPFKPNAETIEPVEALRLINQQGGRRLAIL